MDENKEIDEKLEKFCRLFHKRYYASLPVEFQGQADYSAESFADHRVSLRKTFKQLVREGKVIL